MAEGTGFPGQIQARHPTTSAVLDLFVDPDTNSLRVNVWTWNTSGGTWEKVENLNDKLDMIIGHLETIAANTAP